MRRISGYFLLVIVISFTFSQFAIIINFLSNQDFIAINLCENVAKPELECNGKCYLMKKLKEDEKQKGNDKIVVSEVLLYFQSQTIEIVKEHCFIEQEKHFFELPEVKTNGFQSDVFHPPSLTV